jgi:hypothetical protein
MNATGYLSQTEHAVKQLFAALDVYRSILEADPRPAFIYSGDPDDTDARDLALRAWYNENNAAIQESLQRQREYVGLTFSNAMLCGAVLQISAMGITTYSTNSDIPKSCADYVKPGTHASRFCVGRHVKDVPLGLVVLAARNQYATGKILNRTSSSLTCLGVLRSSQAIPT